VGTVSLVLLREGAVASHPVPSAVDPPRAWLPDELSWMLLGIALSAGVSTMTHAHSNH
jgi:hypothetical protein